MAQAQKLGKILDYEWANEQTGQQMKKGKKKERKENILSFQCLN